MKRALIGGIGNVLLGDDGLGPCVVRLLESEYEFGDDVEVADLGTPALDLTHRIVGINTLILVDSVASNDHKTGTVLLFRKQDILRHSPAQRLDPHSPALSECLLSAEMLGACPEHVLLIGVVGDTYAPGCELSQAVQKSVRPAIAAAVRELRDRGFAVEPQSLPQCPGIWWSNQSFAAVTGHD